MIGTDFPLLANGKKPNSYSINEIKKIPFKLSILLVWRINELQRRQDQSKYEYIS